MGVGERDDIREVIRSQVVVSALDLILYVMGGTGTEEYKIE